VLVTSAIAAFRSSAFVNNSVFSGSTLTWHKILDNAQYHGAYVGSGYKPLVTGLFSKFKAVWRSGCVACNTAYSQDGWQCCAGGHPSGSDVVSFELKKNGQYVVQQANWHTLPSECTIASKPKGDITCTTALSVNTFDSLTPTWYEPSHATSTSDNGGTVSMDLYGWGTPYPSGGAVYVNGGSAAFSSALPANRFSANAPYDCGTVRDGSISGTCKVPTDVALAVRSAADGSTVELAAGTHMWGSLVECSSKTIIVVGAGKGATILDAGNARQFFNLLSGCKLVLRNLSLRNGKTGGYAGAIIVRSGATLEASFVEFKDNKAGVRV
jgi:hypothetical protein